MSVNITLVSDGEHLKHYRPEHYSVFDWIKEIDKSHYVDGVFQPALAKLNINKYSTYDQTLYIDADSLVLQDLSPLFEKLKGCAFKSNAIKGYTHWTDPKTFNDFFGFDYGVTINSSWFYWEEDSIFKQANEYYLKGFDIEKILPKWGGAFPDELFFNAALQKLEINPEVNFDVMFFGNTIDKRTFSEIEKDFFAMTLYGGRKTVRGIYVDFYDRLCLKMCKSLGIEHRFKARDILNGKHVNK